VIESVGADLAGEEAVDLGQAADGKDVQPHDDGSLGGVGSGHEHSIAPFGDGLEGHRQDALDRARLTGERQFPDKGEVARPVDGDLTAAQQQPQSNRQIEAVGVLLEIGDRPRRACEAERCGRSHPVLIFAFLERSYHI